LRGTLGWIGVEVSGDPVLAGLLVLVPPGLLREPLVAVLALERTLARVDPLVGDHVGSLDEALAAESEKKGMGLIRGFNIGVGFGGAKMNNSDFFKSYIFIKDFICFYSFY